MTFIAGVTVGDPVLRTGKPLSVELGPGKVRCPDANRKLASCSMNCFVITT